MLEHQQCPDADAPRVRVMYVCALAVCVLAMQMHLRGLFSVKNPPRSVNTRVSISVSESPQVGITIRRSKDHGILKRDPTTGISMLHLGVRACDACYCLSTCHVDDAAGI